MRCLVACPLLCAVLLSPAVWAQDPDALQGAENAYAELDYQPCVESAQSALTEPAEQADRVKAYQLLGLCQAALGETEAATDAFVLMLAIDPDAQLPEGLSPRFTSSFLEAKGQWMGKRAFEVSFDADETERNLRTLTLTVEDRPGLLKTVAWEDADSERAEAVAVANKMVLQMPAKLATQLVFLDEHEGVLWVVPLPRIEEESSEMKEQVAQDKAEKQAEKEAQEAEAEEGGLGLLPFVGVGALLGVVVIAVVVGGGVVAGLYYAGLIGEPTSVGLNTSVTFAE